MYDDDIVRIVAGLIKNGMNMDKSSIYECNLFMKELNNFINCDTHFNAHYSGDKITIESVFFDPLLSVELDKTTIQCIPITDDGWMDALFEVMKFMHIRRQEQKEKEADTKRKIKEDDKQFDWI
tara:strand:- start:439 stop:810 length:372 start_codon:yes stop_codon:yes gene_type:complete